MSKITAALESAVATVQANRPKDGSQTRRQSAQADRAFAEILKLIAPRFRHFIRQYGLTAHWDDAEQCCAIAVHRAIEAYDPAKAQFTTFVNWQIRGELQSLRFRLMTDQRPSAKKVEATTVSLHALHVNGDGEELSAEALIEDEDALDRTESAAADYLAHGAIESLIDAYVHHLRDVGLEQLRRRSRGRRSVTSSPLHADGPRFRSIAAQVDPEDLAKLEAKLGRDREIITRRIFNEGTLDDLSTETGVTKERVRQITKRATKLLAEIAARDPRFTVMADHLAAASAPKRTAASRTATSILPNPAEPHNRLARVRAIAPGSDYHGAADRRDLAMLNRGNAAAASAAIN